MNISQKDREIARFIISNTYDGDHHKQWLLDQVLRQLIGEEEYKQLIKWNKEEGYDWDEGIPPWIPP